MLDTYKNIKLLRKQNGWTQEELATRMGYTDRSMIAKIESGKVDLARSKILEFAKVFGITASDLMGDDGISIPEDTPEAQEVREFWDEHSTGVKAKAIELYDAYENAPADIRSAIDTLLKSSRPKP